MITNAVAPIDQAASVRARPVLMASTSVSMKAGAKIKTLKRRARTIPIDRLMSAEKSMSLSPRQVQLPPYSLTLSFLLQCSITRHLPANAELDPLFPVKPQKSEYLIRGRYDRRSFDK
jgi:hypothetical protein